MKTVYNITTDSEEHQQLKTLQTRLNAILEIHADRIQMRGKREFFCPEMLPSCKMIMDIANGLFKPVNLTNTSVPKISLIEEETQQCLSTGTVSHLYSANMVGFEIRKITELHKNAADRLLKFGQVRNNVLDFSTYPFHFNNSIYFVRISFDPQVDVELEKEKFRLIQILNWISSERTALDNMVTSLTREKNEYLDRTKPLTDFLLDAPKTLVLSHTEWNEVRMLASYVENIENGEIDLTLLEKSSSVEEFTKQIDDLYRSAK